MTDVSHAAEKATLDLDKVELTQNYLLVQPLAIPERMGRMFIPETSATRERPQRGVVLKVGPGAWNLARAGEWRVPMSIPQGALVFFGKYAGVDETVAGLPVLLMAEDECLMFQPPGTFTVVEHENRKFDHLAGDACEICDKPAEDAAAAAIALERERLRAKIPSGFEVQEDGRVTDAGLRVSTIEAQELLNIVDNNPVEVAAEKIAELRKSFGGGDV